MRDAGVSSSALLLLAVSAGSAGRTAGSPVSPRSARRVTVYVANSGSDTVTPISAANNKPGKPIRVGSGPQQIVISPDGETAYVAARRIAGDSPATLTAIRTATNTAGKVLTMCPAATLPDRPAIAVTPDGKTLYYLCPSANRVMPVRTSTLTVGRPVNAGPFPVAIAITPDGKTAYVASGAVNTVTPISTATDDPGRPIEVGSGPQAIAITPDGKTAFVVTANTVVPISTATNTAGKPITVPGGFAVAITPDGKTAYVVSKPNPGSELGVVVPIHVATNMPGKPIGVGSGPQQILISPDGKTAYVTLSTGVTPIRVATGTAGQAINAGHVPFCLAVTPDGTTLYVVDSHPFSSYGPFTPRGSVIPIRVATSTVGKPIKVGRFPLSIAIAP